MKTKTPDFEIAELNVLSESFFKIDSSNLPHIFNVLRNSLYSDKIMAVIREYSSNAYDANVDAGNPTMPIEVTLPTAIEPEFKVRDFGAGLSENGIFNVFASYGASTKRDTNTQIGAFGLGSKSAFAYVNSFDITSWHQGTKTLYNAFIDETNVGKIVKVLEEKSDAPSGIEISVTVNQSDIRTFHDKAKTYYAWWTVAPTVYNLGESPESWKNNNYNLLIDDKSYALYQHGGYYSDQRAGAAVLMGNTLYSLSGEALDTVGVSEITRDRYFVVFKANIGDFTLASSRESIEYTKSALEDLAERYEELKKKASKAVIKKLNDKSTAVEAVRAYHFDLTAVERVWAGKTFQYKKTLLNPFFYDKVNVSIMTLDKTWSYKNSGYEARWKSNTSAMKECIFEKNKVVFFVNDGGFPAYQTAGRREALKEKFENTYDKCIYIKGTQTEIKEFIGLPEMQGAVVYMLSAILPIEVKSRNKGNHKSTHKVFKWNGKTQFPYSGCWDSIEIEDDDKNQKLYVDITAFKPVNGMSINDLGKTNNLLSSLGIDMVLYGLKPNAKKNKTWIELKDFLNKKCDEILNNPEFQKWYLQMFVADSNKSYRSYYDMKAWILNDHFCTLVIDPDIAAVKSLLPDTPSNTDGFADQLSFVKSINANATTLDNLKSEGRKIVSNIDTTIADLSKKYAMSMHISFSTSYMEDMATYINAKYLALNP